MKKADVEKEREIHRRFERARVEGDRRLHMMRGAERIRTAHVTDVALAVEKMEREREAVR